MKLTHVALLFASVLAVCAVHYAHAGELDNSPAFTHGLIVRVNAQGAREVFKADLAAQVENASDAVAANTQFVTEANRVAHVVAGSELDRTSSSEAWCYWHAPAYYGGYYYTYNYGYAYNIGYYPTYYTGAYYGGYQYYYYWYHY